MGIFILVISALIGYGCFQLGMTRADENRRDATRSIKELETYLRELRKEVKAFKESKIDLSSLVSELTNKEATLISEIKGLEQYINSQKISKLSDLDAEVSALKRSATSKVVEWAEKEESRIGEKINKQVIELANKAFSEAYKISTQDVQKICEDIEGLQGIGDDAKTVILNILRTFSDRNIPTDVNGGVRADEARQTKSRAA